MDVDESAGHTIKQDLWQDAAVGDDDCNVGLEGIDASKKSYVLQFGRLENGNRSRGCEGLRWRRGENFFSAYWFVWLADYADDFDVFIGSKCLENRSGEGGGAKKDDAHSLERFGLTYLFGTIDEQNAVQVIDFVLENNGQQFAGVDDRWAAVFHGGFDGYRSMAANNANTARNR